MDGHDPDEKITCPYNSSHHIRRCRMTIHLVKCKLNFAVQRKVPCCFNSNHMVCEPELSYHHSICGDRKRLEPRIVECQSQLEQERYPMHSQIVETEENWDDSSIPAYDPTVQAEGRDILRQRNLLSAAKKRDFRFQERKRLGEMSETNGPSKPPEQDLPQTSGMRLPPHRATTTVEDARFDSSALKEKLKREYDKVFLQYKDRKD